MIRPSIGVLTHIGSAHDAGFASRRDKVFEKLRLFEGARGLIFCRDAEDVESWVTEWHEGLPAAQRPVLLAWTAQADDRSDARTQRRIKFESDHLVISHPSHPSASDVGAGRELRLALPCPFREEASRQNLAHALFATLAIAGGDGGDAALRTPGFAERLAAAIPQLPHLRMRLQVYPGRQGSLIVDDSYSSDQDGLAAAAIFFTQQRRPNDRAIWILGGLGGQNTFVTDLARRHRVDLLVTVGEPCELGDEGLAHRHFSTVEEALSQLPTLDVAHGIVLVKGPRTRRLNVSRAHCGHSGTASGWRSTSRRSPTTSQLTATSSAQRPGSA